MEKEYKIKTQIVLNPLNKFESHHHNQLMQEMYTHQNNKTSTVMLSIKLQHIKELLIMPLIYFLYKLST